MELDYSYRNDRREALTQLLVDKMKVFANAWTPSPVRSKVRKAETVNVRNSIPIDIGADVVRENLKYPKSSLVGWEPSSRSKMKLTIRQVLPRSKLGGFLEHKSNLGYRLSNAFMFDSGLDRTVILNSKPDKRRVLRKLPELSKKNLSRLGQLPCIRDCSADPTNLDRMGRSLHKTLRTWYKEDKEELWKLQSLDRAIFR